MKPSSRQGSYHSLPIWWRVLILTAIPTTARLCWMIDSAVVGITTGVPSFLSAHSERQRVARILQYYFTILQQVPYETSIEFRRNRNSIFSRDPTIPSSSSVSTTTCLFAWLLDRSLLSKPTPKTCSFKPSRSIKIVPFVFFSNKSWRQSRYCFPAEKEQPCSWVDHHHFTKVLFPETSWALPGTWANRNLAFLYNFLLHGYHHYQSPPSLSIWSIIAHIHIIPPLFFHNNTDSFTRIIAGAVRVIIINANASFHHPPMILPTPLPSWDYPKHPTRPTPPSRAAFSKLPCKITPIPWIPTNYPNKNKTPAKKPLFAPDKPLKRSRPVPMA